MSKQCKYICGNHENANVPKNVIVLPDGLIIWVCPVHGEMSLNAFKKVGRDLEERVYNMVLDWLSDYEWHEGCTTPTISRVGGTR